MKATLLDTETGEMIEAAGYVPRSYEWAENGWSCDCNREGYFGHSTKSDTCLGSRRYLVVAAQFSDKPNEYGDPEDYRYSLRELNSDYPYELLKKHLHE